MLHAGLQQLVANVLHAGLLVRLTSGEAIRLAQAVKSLQRLRVLHLNPEGGGNKKPLQELRVHSGSKVSRSSEADQQVNLRTEINNVKRASILTTCKVYLGRAKASANKPLQGQRSPMHMSKTQQRV